MKSFEYAQPVSLQEALLLLRKERGEVLAMGGGTSLLSLLKDGLAEPRKIVSLASVDELKEIRFKGTSLQIGAMATLTDLLESERVRRLYPSVIDAVEAVASPQLRNQGTAGGQVMRRPECWYFRRGYGLYGTGPGVSLPEEGDHRDHAVFGNSGPAKFVNSSRLAPVFWALDASFMFVTAYRNVGEGEMMERPISRGIKVFFRHDGSRVFTVPKSVQETGLIDVPEALLSHLWLPPRMPTAAYYEVRSRKGLDQPEASATVALEMDGDTVRRARVVLGHVAPIPWRVDVNEVLYGQPVTEATAEAASKLAVAGATPLPHNQHKVELARIATKRALLKAIGRIDQGVDQRRNGK